jgi:nitrite reductase/ring-hydroxylating ferredoxin subunit
MTLPRMNKQRYVSPELARLEWERVWKRSWLLAAHVSGLREAGDVVRFDVGPESILVVRGAPGDAGVRSFFNVCQHRGTRLVDADAAHVRSLRCPYHHWEWSLDGALRNVPRAETFLCGAPAGELRLRDVRSELRHGFVWVALAEPVEEIDRWLEPIAPELERLAAASLSLVRATTVDVECNWKTSVDVHSEGYHLATLHPELAGAVDFAGVVLEPRDRHGLSRVPLRSGGEKRTIHVFPNVELNSSAEGLELYRHRPDARDVERMVFEELVLAPRAVLPPERRRGRVGEVDLGPVLGADVELLARIQRGMHSEGFSGAYLSSEESLVENFHRALDAMMAGP